MQTIMGKSSADLIAVPQATDYEPLLRDFYAPHMQILIEDEPHTANAGMPNFITPIEVLCTDEATEQTALVSSLKDRRDTGVTVWPVALTFMVLP